MAIKKVRVEGVDYELEGKTATVLGEAAPGTAVPNSGRVYTVYFNTSLTNDDIKEILNNAGIDSYYYILHDDACADYGGCGVTISSSSDGKIIIQSMEGWEYSTIFDGTEWLVNEYSLPSGNAFSSFYDDMYGEILVTGVGAKNGQLTNLVSITPFETTTKELKGEYNGAGVSVTENGTVDISAMLNEQKLPLEIDVNVPVPEGTLEITDNGEHDVKNYAKVNVNVQGGAGATVLGEVPPGTQVPNTGTVNSVYFNTSLTVDDIKELIKESGISTTYYILKGFDGTDATGPAITITYSQLSDLILSPKIQYIPSDGADAIAIYGVKNDEYVWLVDKIEWNNETFESSGNSNDKLTNLVSITPFEANIKTLSGEYDGDEVNIVVSGDTTVDIDTLIDEGKLPLKINASLASGYVKPSGVIDITSNTGIDGNPINVAAYNGVRVNVPQGKIWTGGTPLSNGAEVTTIYVDCEDAQSGYGETFTSELYDLLTFEEDENGEYYGESVYIYRTTDNSHYLLLEFDETEQRFIFSGDISFDSQNYNNEIPSEIVINGTLVMDDNNIGLKLKNRFSTTPFTEKTEKLIVSEYIGADLEVTANGEIDIEALMDQGKLPLKIKVNVTSE